MTNSDNSENNENDRSNKAVSHVSDHNKLLWSRDRQKFMMMLHFTGSLINYSSRTAMALCMPHMAQQFSWDKKQQGLVLGSFLWGYPLTQIFGGFMSDRYGAELMLLISACCWSTVTLLTPSFPVLAGSGSASASLTLIVISRLTQGVCQGMHYPSVMSAIGQHCMESEQTLVYSVVAAGCAGGALFTGLAGSIILEKFGWQSVFRFLGMLGITWVVALYIFGDIRRNRRLRVLQDVTEVNEKLLTTESKPHSEVTESKQSVFPWSKVLRAPPFWAMLAAHFAEGYTFFVFLFWLPTFFTENYPQAKPWVYNVLPWIVDMSMSVLFGNLASAMLKRGYSKTFTRKSLNIVAMLVFGAALLSVGASDSFSLTLLLFCMATAGHGAYHSTILMNPSDITPDHTGFMFGIMNTCGAIPGFLGTYISGAILESTGNWSLMYAVTGCVCITGWAVFGYFGSGEPIV